MLTRVLEPEVMDTAEEAADYDAMDHSEVNRRFVGDLLAAWLAAPESVAVGSKPTVLDVGTGTALIPIELCRRVPGVSVVAIDLAEQMLALAGRNVAAAGLTDRITLRLCDAKQTGRSRGAFDAVVSNSIVHHIPQPASVLSEMWRLLRPGGLYFVRDLLRPNDAAAVERLVARHAGGESARQQQLFRQSLHAALTIPEVAELLAPLGLPVDAVRATSDRHWTIAAVKPRAVQIALEEPRDARAVHELHEQCFGRADEARLIDALRASGRLSLALVAEADETIVGQIGFSPVTTAAGDQGVGLAPLAVRETHRRRGIAAELVRAGLARCRDAGWGWAVVLGDPRYYARFGFRPAAEFGLVDEYGGGPAFQALELIPGRLPRGVGLVRYAPEFAALP